MTSQFRVSERFGGGQFDSVDAAEAAIARVYQQDSDYRMKSDIVEVIDGLDVIFDGEVPVSLLGEFKKAVAKLNKRATKVGVPAMVAKYSEVFVKVVLRSDPETGKHWRERYEAVTAKVAGQKIKLNGFEFFGRVDNEAGVGLICNVPGKEIPAQYRVPSNFCDHCKANRQRKSYYIFQSEAGDFLKVGSTCLKDYMGHNAAGVLFLASLQKEFDSWNEDMDGPRVGAGEKGSFPGMILAVAAAVIRDTGGFVSRAAADAYAAKSGGEVHLQVTSSVVSDQLFTRPPFPKGFKRLPILEVDRRVAQKAKAWFKAEVERKEAKGQSLSDYEFNLNALVGTPFVSAKRLGIMVSLVGVYLRAMGLQAERKAKDAGMVNAYIGQPGKRRVFEGTFVQQRSFEGQYGVTFYTKIATPEGVVVVKSSTKWWSGDLEEGRKLSFLATIKQHKEWNGRFETIVNRAVDQSPVDGAMQAA